jgi:hypothetical protein
VRGAARAPTAAPAVSDMRAIQIQEYLALLPPSTPQRLLLHGNPMLSTTHAMPQVGGLPARPRLVRGPAAGGRGQVGRWACPPHSPL